MKNTLAEWEYVKELWFWTLSILFWAVEFFFRFIPGVSHLMSWIILGIIILVVSGVNIWGSYKRDRNYGSIFMGMVCIWGVFVVIAYWDLLYGIQKGLLYGGLVLSTTNCVLILCQKIKRPERRSYIIKERLFKCFYVTRRYMAFTLLLIMIPLGINKMDLGVPIRISVPEKVMLSTQEPPSIENRIDVLINLEENRFSKLDLEERLELCRTIIAVEQEYLGISAYEVQICVDDLEPYIGGYWNDENRVLCISSNVMKKDDDSMLLLSILCHEVYHIYEHRILETVSDLDLNELDKRLLVFRRALEYGEEFENYVGASRMADAHEEYYNQLVEEDARAYSTARVLLYIETVGNYLAKVKAEQE